MGYVVFWTLQLLNQSETATSFVFPTCFTVTISRSAKRATILCVLSLLRPISFLMYFCRYFPLCETKTARATKSDFESQDIMAEHILNNERGRIVAVRKATRAGATFSLLKKAFELGQKTVIVAPYRKIFDETVNDVAQSFPAGHRPKILRITANKEMCKKVQEKIVKYSALDAFPFHSRPKCEECEYNDPGDCVLQEALVSADWDIIGITYAKLKYICLGNSKVSKVFIEKIHSSVNLILDEFTTGILATTPSFELVDPYDTLERIFHSEVRMAAASNVEGTFWSGLNLFALYMKHEADELKRGQHIFCENFVTGDVEDFFEKNAVKCWGIIERLATEDIDTKLLRQMMQVIASKRVVIIKSSKGMVSVQPVEDLNERTIRGYDYLKDFLNSYVSANKVVALIDACLPDLEFEKLLGIDVRNFPWGDPLNTNKSQLIICDTRKIGEIEFFKTSKRQKEIKATINLESKLQGEKSIAIVALNKHIHRQIKNVWMKNGEIPAIFASYYRSQFSRGFTIDPNHRSLVLVGAPYLPKVAYLAETFKTDLLRAFQMSDVKSAFINMIGRVKDPLGKQKSVVFATGITASEVRGFVTQTGLSTPLIAEFPVKGADAFDFAILAHLFRHSEELSGKWVDLERDLPLLVRILRLCDKKGNKVPVSEILCNDKERANQFVEDYTDVLGKFGIKVVKEGSGSRLEATVDLKQYFPLYSI